ncbi:MAG: pyridoxamine 5'-phosphate oxidase family protein [Curvibacter sp.]
MELARHWSEVKRVVGQGQRSSIHCAIASVSPDGTPHVTPVGTVFLRDDLTGYYFDQYTSSLAQNLDLNPNLCLTAVNTGSWFWLKSLWSGRFGSPPGVRLYGTAGPLRAATQEELQGIQERVKPTNWLRGSRLLWSDFRNVRDIAFTAFRPVSYPKMMEGLWRADA